MSEAHITPVRTYLLVFVALLALTALTVAVAEIDLGAFNTVAALAIASMKALLVALFFMHLRSSPFITRVAIAGAVAFVLLLLGGTLDDVLTRHSPTYLPYESVRGQVPSDAGERAAEDASAAAANESRTHDRTP